MCSLPADKKSQLPLKCQHVGHQQKVHPLHVRCSCIVWSFVVPPISRSLTSKPQQSTKVAIMLPFHPSTHGMCFVILRFVHVLRCLAAHTHTHRSIFRL